MDKVRIGAVRYLNTVPLIEGLEKLAGVELVLAVPSRLGPMLASGELDVALVSLADSTRSEVPFAQLPVGMIGCDGPTLTVRLFSTVPFDRIATVHADTDSVTSVVLCQVLLERLYGVRPRILAFDAPEHAQPAKTTPDWPQSLLLIGDKVVNDAPPAARYPHQLDLGEAWTKHTGLPFVYALWMCRAAEAGSATVRTAAAVLDRQRRHNLTRLDWIVSTRAPEHRWPTDLARRYLGELLRYQVGERERRGAEHFLAEASTLGLLPGRALVWADGAMSAPAHGPDTP